MDRRLFKAYGAGCARSLVVQIVVGVVALCILPAIILVSMLMPLPPELEEYRPILWAFGFVAFLGLFTVAAVAWMLWSKRQRAGQFDEAFATLGLSGSNYMLVGRQYHGQVNGRQVDIYFYRGPILDIYLASPLRTRMGVGLSSALSSAASNLLKRPALQTGHAELAQYVFYPIDERWGRELLDDPQARAAILRLLETPSSYEIRTLFFEPEALQIKANHISPGRITAEAARQWINDLLLLAELAERLPAPTVTAQPSGLARTTRTDRNRLYWIVGSVTCGFFALMMVFILVISFVMIYFMEAGG